ncbi:EYxxD motif small membrane protein [Bacillus sp. EB600]|uniref:EYxxD motif small membrane protein n=1 Tax=Bacillus sp. EB600 TaxID=2806345 RepID=UPI0035BF3C70
MVFRYILSKYERSDPLIERSSFTVFYQYASHLSFVLILLIGSIIALLLVYMRKSNKRRAR